MNAEGKMKHLLITTIAAVLLSLSVQGQESRTPQLQNPSPVKSQKAKTPNKTETGTRISRNPVELITRWLIMDKNGDGKLAVDETTGQLKTSFNRNDANKDGFLDRGELETLSKRLIRRRSRGQSPGPKPTHAGVPYGTGQELIDMYLAKSNQPTPVYIWGHAKGQTYKRIPTKALSLCNKAGFSFFSIEANDTDNSGSQDISEKEPWLKMLDFVKANAKKYNIDTRNIFIGGRSLGSMGSFPAAMERWKEVRGVYSMQALPRGGKLPAALVHKNSPPSYLIYRSAPGSNNHDPRNGLMVQDAYKEKGIGDRISIKTEIRDQLWFTWLIDFMQTKRESSSANTAAKGVEN